jgi:Tol biopolymer transport system component
VAFGAWSMRPEPIDPPVARFSVTPAEGQRFTTGVRQLIALSPDGQWMAWAGIGRIWVRSVSEFDAHPVAGIETNLALTAPVFSPDGESLAFYSPDDRAFRRIALSGGAPVMICPAGLAPNGMSWDASGLVFTQPGGIFRCNASGGQPEQLAKIEDDEQGHGPQILPGGRALIFTIAKDADGLERWNKSRIVVQSLVSGERRTLIEGGSDARYLPTGHLVYALEGSVFGVLFDLERLVTTGGAVSVVEGVRRSAAASSGAAHFATSDSGTLVYVPGPARPNSFSVVAVADRAGSVTPLKMPPGRYVHVRASRDGRLLAVDTDDGKEANVSTFELSGVSAMRRLTFGGRNRFPVWSPDGQRIAFQSDRDGAPAIFAQRLDGTGVERLTTPGEGETHVPESWSSDGKHLSFAVQKKGDEFTLWTLSLADGKVTRFRDVLSTEPFASVFSPDGRWIAYHTLPPGALSTSVNSGVFVEPFPPTGALYQAPRVSRDFHPVWSRDGAELFYVGTTTSGQAAAVPVTTRSGITFGPVATFPFVVTAGRLSASTRGFDALPNNAFVGVVAESASDRASANPEIRVVLNWFEELKRIVPHP